MNQNLTTASQTALAGVGAGQEDLNQARVMNTVGATGQTDQMTAGQFDQAAAQQYMNPYLSEVQGRTLEEMGRQNQMARQDLGDQTAAAKSFGGTRHAVLEAEQGKAQNANMLDYLASSNAAAYDSAANIFASDRAADMQAQQTNIASQSDFYNRLMQGAGQASSIAGQDNALRSNQILDLLKTGGVEQETQNAALSADYNEFLRMQDAEMDRYSDLMAILSGTPRDVTTNTSGTSTTQQKTGWLQTALGVGQIAASVASDPRLKTEVELLERRPDGLGIYAFKYIWDATKQMVGFMADEVERLAPWALGPTIAGYRTVNYRKLGKMA
jgi:hypothetical protein